MPARARHPLSEFFFRIVRSLGPPLLRQLTELQTIRIAGPISACPSASAPARPRRSKRSTAEFRTTFQARSIRGTGAGASPSLPPAGLAWQARRPECPAGHGAGGGCVPPAPPNPPLPAPDLNPGPNRPTPAASAASTMGCCFQFTAGGLAPASPPRAARCAGRTRRGSASGACAAAAPAPPGAPSAPAARARGASCRRGTES